MVLKKPLVLTSGGIQELASADWVRGDGWQIAGFGLFASAAASSGAITVPAFDELMIVVRVVGMSATTDVPSLRFNADTGNNYRSRFLVNNATSGTTLTDVPTASVSRAELSGMGSNAQRTIQAVLNNKATVSKLGVVTSAIGSGAAGTQQKIDLAGHFEWVNTSVQITSVELRSSGGSVTFSIDTGILIFGRSFV